MVLARASYFLHGNGGQVPDLELEITSFLHNGMARVQLKELLIEDADILVSTIEKGSGVLGEQWAGVDRSILQSDLRAGLTWGAVVLDRRTRGLSA
jgi:hypothetical protein